MVSYSALNMGVNRNYAIDYLKFYAVLFIIVDHAIEVYLGFNYYIWLLGAVGVSIFVFVSGYLARESSAGKVFNPKKYMLSRIVKLFPLYLLACLLQYAFLSYSPEAQVSRLFMVNALHLWFVPMILLMYGMFTIKQAYPRVFPVAVAVYCIYYLAVTVGCLWVGDFNGVFTTGLYWLLLLGVFFAGVKSKPIKWKLPKSYVVDLVAQYSYPIYLFQYPFIYAIKGVGLGLGLAYVGFALAAFLCLKVELSKRE